MPVQAWTGREAPQKFEAPKISRELAKEGGTVVSFTRGPPLLPKSTVRSEGVSQ
jgi:hypothetical protein